MNLWSPLVPLLERLPGGSSLVEGFGDPLAVLDDSDPPALFFEARDALFGTLRRAIEVYDCYDSTRFDDGLEIARDGQ